MSDSSYLYSRRELDLGPGAGVLPARVVTTAPGAPPAPTDMRPSAARVSVRPTALDHGDIAQAIADIEQATHALRRAEPGLEVWASTTGEQRTLPPPQSVWFVIGVVWTSTIAVVGGTIFMIVSLLS